MKAIVGGLHLYDRSEDEVLAFAHDLDESGVELVLTGHCTGEAVSTLAGCSAHAYRRSGRETCTSSNPRAAKKRASRT